MKDEVYCYKRRVKACIRKVKSSCVDDESKAKILEFYREYIIMGYSKARIIKYLGTLERIGRDLGKLFTQAKKEDIVNLIAKIEQRNYSELIKHDYKVILRMFYRRLRKCDYPEEVS